MMHKITEKQREFISAIEEFVHEKFSGTTKEEATKYIERNIEEFKLRSSSMWALENGYF